MSAESLNALARTVAPVFTDPFLLELFLAVAMVESNGGDDMPVNENNPVRLAPKRDDSVSVHDSNVRVFSCVEDCARAWLYQLQKSPDHNVPRAQFFRRMERLQADYVLAKTKARKQFVEEFATAAKPLIPTYPRQINAALSQFMSKEPTP